MFHRDHYLNSNRSRYIKQVFNTLHVYNSKVDELGHIAKRNYKAMEQNKLHVLLSFHNFLDWMNRWGSPRMPSEEANFYEEQAKIQEDQMGLKPLAQRFKLYSEKFVEDFEKEHTLNTEVGNTFIKDGHDVIESLKSLPDLGQEQPLVAELEKIMNTSIARVKKHMNQ